MNATDEDALTRSLTSLASAALLSLSAWSFARIVKGYRARGGVAWLASITFALAAIGALLALHALLSP